MRILKLLVLVGSLIFSQVVIAEMVSGEWVSAADKSAQKPLYQKNSDSNFWFEEIEGEHAVYWQFNEVYDTVKESIAKFATRLTSYVARYGIHRLILDLRFNMGGNNTVVHVNRLADGLSAKIDFIDLDANGLALEEVTFEAPVLGFGFPNGDGKIGFEGTLHGSTIIGMATMQGQTYPWVVLRR